MVHLSEISQDQSFYVHDVFLSFRGADTRNSFTDHLHKALLDANIDTFLDDAEMKTGQELKTELVSAIKTSKASIIVLSKNYASSTWCLDELALIMEQHRTTKHVVFPIFYHVEPTDVRKQQMSFLVAMDEHEQKMEAETDAKKKSEWGQKIEKWKKALTEVADLKGIAANDKRETILIEGIVKEIHSRLDLQKRSNIMRLIGRESIVREITSFLKNESANNTAHILTIWGMAGIGKTCLADYIFKLHYHDFERSCFLEDVERRCREPDGLLDLQKKLLKDIQDGSWMDIDNTYVGTFKIEKSLLRRKTLLVLDSVDNLERLDVLIGAKGLHPGSKIIITSKNGSLTEKCRLFQTQVPPRHSKHFLIGLNEKESLQLLSWHAFGCNEPKEDEKNGSIKVVKYCRGHPLAIKVLGSSIRNEDATMEDILESLGKEINPDIKKVLRISFDSLPYEKDKELFKHIACLFVGADKKLTEEILRACGICKSFGIMILINRCLLTLASNKLVMHQLLQDMGRDLVLQESPKKPWKRSLLWNHEECLDVLQNRKGTTRIKGLVLDMKKDENEDAYRGMSSQFETLAIREMLNLRLLQLNYVELNGSYNSFPKGLRWLCMHGFPLSYIPSDLPMENMVALDMSNSKLQHLWKEPKLLRSLKFLNLRSCFELVSVGPFSGLPALENLILERCTSLVEVCESVGTYCGRLEVLDMRECNKLKKLPNSIGKLKNLTKLVLDGCSNLAEFPVEMMDMESLKSDCFRLKTVLGAPSKINYMLISDCYSLEKVTFHQEMSALPCVTYFRGECLTEIEGKFKLQVLSEISEEILCSLGWMNIEYLRYYNVSMADSDGNYRFLGKIILKQMLYEHGIFSTYLSGQDVPKWFTHRSNEPSFTVPSSSSPKNRRICGINLCIVSTMSNPKEVGPSRVEIRNLTKNRSLTYQPILFALPADPEFEYGDDVEVWLSHWMFAKNEFEDGDQVSVHFSKKFYSFSSEDDCFLYYTDGGTDCANVREYGISLVYDDGIKNEDPLAYYKSWNHIISRDLSAANMSSYLLKQW